MTKIQKTDIQKIISSLKAAKLQYESEAERYSYVPDLSKVFEGTAGGLDLAIKLIKIESGISITDKFVEDDVHLDEGLLV